VRAVDVWFGLGWESTSAGRMQKTLEVVLRFLDDPKARDRALRKEKGEPLYLALWTLGFEDAMAAVQPAAALLADKDVERRFPAVYFLTQLGLPAARRELVRCLEDDDLRIADRALDAMDAGDNLDLFDRLVKLYERFPERPKELPALVWPWATSTV